LEEVHRAIVHSLVEDRSWCSQPSNTRGRL